MDDTTYSTQGKNHQTTSTNFGTQLRTARECMRLSEKEAAARLRLNPNLIHVMENENFTNSPPPTFMRGYLRSYARMLNLSESDISLAIERFNLTLPSSTASVQSSVTKKEQGSKLDHYLRWSGYLIMATLVTLVITWWASHPRFSEADGLSKQMADGSSINVNQPASTETAPPSSPDSSISTALNHPSIGMQKLLPSGNAAINNSRSSTSAIAQSATESDAVDEQGIY